MSVAFTTRSRPTETPIDQIATTSEFPAAVVSSILLRLELKRLVKQLPGKYSSNSRSCPQRSAVSGSCKPGQRGLVGIPSWPKPSSSPRSRPLRLTSRARSAKFPRRATTTKTTNTSSRMRSAISSNSRCRKTSTRRNTASGGWRRCRSFRKNSASSRSRIPRSASTR